MPRGGLRMPGGATLICNAGEQLRDHCGRTGAHTSLRWSWRNPRAKDSHKRPQISALKAEIGSYAKAKIRGFSSFWRACSRW